MAAEANAVAIAAASVQRMDLDLKEDELGFEEDIQRNELSMRAWCRYIDHLRKKKEPMSRVCRVYERALKIFDHSYKLWYQYLRYRRRIIAHKSPTDVEYERLADTYERCLVFLHKMPRLWIDYCELMTKRRLITATRRVFDRAIRALPVTQHDRIWPLYVTFCRSHDIPETTVRVYRRYVKLAPHAREDFVEYLLSIDRLDEAAVQLATLVNEDKDISERGKTSHQLWSELCQLVSKNPTKIHSLRVDPIIRQGIVRFSDQVGILWCALAEYYVRAGQFERGRDIYEEAMLSVKTVRDFSQIFDAYAQFMERAVDARMQDVSETNPDDVELEMLFARFEHLMERRQLLLNSVLLRQNPHNVHEWLNRVKLYDGRPDKQIETFVEAVRTVQPKLQVGRLSELWVEFAKFYETGKQPNDARAIFEKALQAPYAKVDELATVWCEYAEFELRQKEEKKALHVLKRATTPLGAGDKKASYFDDNETVQARVHRSLRVWSLYVDLEECFGTLNTVRAAYERILDLRIATPQTIINYALFLEEHDYFEDSFRAYERGIALFRWPQIFDIWNSYLTKFIKRYGGKKLERARDLFEQCLEQCPPKFAKNIYLLYAKLEEEHGLARHAMNIYNRATEAVDKPTMYSMFNIYLKKAAELYGLSATRPIYEHAISVLPEDRSRDMSLRFAQMERALGEIDRARAIYAHAAEVCDPRIQTAFWETWKQFEMAHGNEDTMREMLRVKRSVQATYNTSAVAAHVSAQQLAAGSAPVETGAGDSMAMLEARAQIVQQEKAASRAGGSMVFVRGESKTHKEATTENPDEIALDDDEDEEMAQDGGGEAPEPEQRVVPSGVFGGLIPSAKPDEEW